LDLLLKLSQSSLQIGILDILGLRNLSRTLP
jgi:hypothetical protein